MNTGLPSARSGKPATPRCPSCGYDLRAALDRDACPECGLALRGEAAADRLHQADGRWLTATDIGLFATQFACFFLAWRYLVLLALGLESAMTVASLLIATAEVVAMLASPMLVVGLWFLAKPPPGDRLPRRLRQLGSWIRPVVVVTAAAWGGVALWAAGVTPGGDAALAVVIVVMAGELATAQLGARLLLGWREAMIVHEPATRPRLDAWIAWWFPLMRWPGFILLLVLATRGEAIEPGRPLATAIAAGGPFREWTALAAGAAVLAWGGVGLRLHAMRGRIQAVRVLQAALAGGGAGPDTKRQDPGDEVDSPSAPADKTS